MPTIVTRHKVPRAEKNARIVADDGGAKVSGASLPWCSRVRRSAARRMVSAIEASMGRPVAVSGSAAS